MSFQKLRKFEKFSYVDMNNSLAFIENIALPREETLGQFHSSLLRNNM